MGRNLSRDILPYVALELQQHTKMELSFRILSELQYTVKRRALPSRGRLPRYQCAILIIIVILLHLQHDERGTLISGLGTGNSARLFPRSSFQLPVRCKSVEHKSLHSHLSYDFATTS